MQKASLCSSCCFTAQTTRSPNGKITLHEHIDAPLVLVAARHGVHFQKEPTTFDYFFSRTSKTSKTSETHLWVVLLETAHHVLHHLRHERCCCARKVPYFWLVVFFQHYFHPTSHCTLSFCSCFCWKTTIDNAKRVSVLIMLFKCTNNKVTEWK